MLRRRVPTLGPARPGRGLTSVEERIDRWARRRISGTLLRGGRPWLVEAVVFVLKQAWACIFGAVMLALLVLARLFYPAQAPVDQGDVLTVLAALVQVVMVWAGLETRRELRVVVLFHLVGTVMELFKTSVGSWSYPGDGLLRVGEVPLYSGFMYAAVGSYLVRVHRIFDLRFEGYPPRAATALLGAAAYVNFFTNHWVQDLRWPLIAAVVAAYLPTVMHVRVLAARLRMPVLAALVGTATMIWVAENVATWAGAWLYPGQQEAWQLVHPEKVTSWFLLMIISVALVTWVYPPRPPAGRRGAG